MVTQNRCAHKEKYLLFYLFKAFDYIESSQNSIFYPKDLLSCLRNMFWVTIYCKYKDPFYSLCQPQKKTKNCSLKYIVNFL